MLFFYVLVFENGEGSEMVVQLPKLKCLSSIVIRNVYFPPFYSFSNWFKS